MDETFSLPVDKVFRLTSGLVQEEGRWLTGSALNTEFLSLERTGEAVRCREVEFAQGPLSLALICGRMRDAADAVFPGSKTALSPQSALGVVRTASAR